MSLQRFQVVSCSYDTKHRSICMDCYQPLMSNTREGLSSVQETHRCSVIDLSVSGEFPEPAPEATAFGGVFHLES